MNWFRHLVQESWPKIDFLFFVHTGIIHTDISCKEGEFSRRVIARARLKGVRLRAREGLYREEHQRNMEGFERLNLAEHQQKNYVPFDQFLQQHYGGPSNLTANAAEFVPNTRREQVSTESTVGNGGDFGANGYTTHQRDDETYKGAIRKQYTNNNHGRNYRNNTRPTSQHHNQQKAYNRGRHYGESDPGFNGYKDNWRRRDDYRRSQQGPGPNRDLPHKSRNNKNHDNNRFYTKVPNHQTPKKTPEATYLTFDASNCSQREKLTKEIENSVLECMICCENIKSVQSVFSCNACYHIFHLSCITKWATSSFTEGWRCPACNSFKEFVPKEYFCFCNKQKDPQFNRNDTAHSCGEMCGRSCEQGDHKCTLLCHPGEFS